MATVFRAVDTKSGHKSVAIKMFSEQIDGNKHHLLAYSREQAALERLVHPNIVVLLDGGRHSDGRRYLVLEWIERSLLDEIANRPYQSWEQFYSEIGSPVLDAL